MKHIFHLMILPLTKAIFCIKSYQHTGTTQNPNKKKILLVNVSVNGFSESGPSNIDFCSFFLPLLRNDNGERGMAMLLPPPVPIGGTARA